MLALETRFRNRAFRNGVHARFAYDWFRERCWSLLHVVTHSRFAFGQKYRSPERRVGSWDGDSHRCRRFPRRGQDSSARVTWSTTLPFAARPASRHASTAERRAPFTRPPTPTCLWRWSMCSWWLEFGGAATTVRLTAGQDGTRVMLYAGERQDVTSCVCRKPISEEKCRRSV